MKPAILILLLIARAAAGADDETRIAHSEYFDLHSDPWINLHHFLYQWSRADEGIGDGRKPVVVAERASLPELSPRDLEAWNEALSFYRANIARRSHFDDDMLEQKSSLRKLAGQTDAVPVDAIAGVGAALRAAMPVYLAYWWSGHDRLNRQWVDAILEDLLCSESSFVGLTERVYSAEWPGERRRVDVSAYANFAAGYTAFGHIVIFSSDPGNQGIYGLETVFHEVQHTREIRRPAIARLEGAFGADEPPLPDNFWHSLIFATAGAFVAEFANNEGREVHLPYWERERFDRLAGWRDSYRLVNEYWLPVIAGDLSTEDAMREIALALSKTDLTND